MGRLHNAQAKRVEDYEDNAFSSGRVTRLYQNDFKSKARLNLNDLLKRRNDEKAVDKKTNLIIFLGAVGVAAVVVAILSF